MKQWIINVNDDDAQLINWLYTLQASDQSQALIYDDLTDYSKELMALLEAARENNRMSLQ
ncbi:hypothetical protein [Furfurilactobacillus curtus]|uniref:Uncharacterized protein n=1 Tax=Furfurilactobacillus curtus TaxID=1746200 RepID=A0ABQ5JQS1_9LACO